MIQKWMAAARDVINARGLYNPSGEIFIDQVTKNEAEMLLFEEGVGTIPPDDGRKPPEPREREPKDRAPRKIIR